MSTSLAQETIKFVCESGAITLLNKKLLIGEQPNYMDLVIQFYASVKSRHHPNPLPLEFHWAIETVQPMHPQFLVMSSEKVKSLFPNK